MYLAKKNSVCCTAYTTNHHKCRLQAVKKGKGGGGPGGHGGLGGSGGPGGLGGPVCAIHANYYVRWWDKHLPIIGWRSNSIRIRSEYMSGFAHISPPSQDYIDSIPSSELYYDYWLALCVAYAGVIDIRQKERLFHYIVREYTSQRLDVSNDEWYSLFHDGHGHIRHGMVEDFWKQICRVYFHKMIRFHMIFCRGEGRARADVFHKLCEPWKLYICDTIGMLAGVVPWFLLSDEIDCIIRVEGDAFVKAIEGGESQVVASNFVHLIKQVLYDNKRVIMGGWKGWTDMFKEELVSLAWHPRRVSKWIEAGGIEILEKL